MIRHFFRPPPDREDDEDDDPLEEPLLELDDEREGALNDLDGETELLDGAL